jgi:serine phosphatase RsbU (regulator of sigma subunit)
VSKAEGLWQQARVMIGETAQREQAYRRLRAAQQAGTLRNIGQNLTTTIDMASLTDMIAEGLPQLGIPGCYLSLYEGQEMPPERSRLILGYDESGRVELEVGGRVFPTSQLVPGELLQRDGRYSMVLEPLYFRDSQLGMALLEMGPWEGEVYEDLRGELSSALQGVSLVGQVESRAIQLQTAAEVSQAASSILDPSALIQRVVDLARERFDLYYAGLFLLDDDGQWAELRAGTGEAGQKMVAQGHKLEVGGESMIGRCVTGKQAIIALDVGEEAVRFDNPFLPETRSEMALPLVSRDLVLGALTIQSKKREAFGAEDVAVFQTMAGQLANAIANARLYKEAQRLNNLLKEENLRMEAELEVTRRLQQMLLPTEDELRQIEKLDIAGFMEPAEEVGGDYYDVLKHNGDIKIGIGDVTGHGLESGVVMLMLQTAVRTLQTSEETDPARFMDILNRLLYDNTQRMQVGKSMTLALLDYHLGQVRLSGQHEKIIVMRKGGAVELKDTRDLGFPLGLEQRITQWVGELSIELAPGDGVVLYSDGITEAENEDEEFYGLERLCQVVSEHWGETADEIKGAVVADVLGFIGKQKVYDDITLVVVKQK